MNRGCSREKIARVGMQSRGGRETKRDFGWTSEDICKEYIVTVWGVGWMNVDMR